VRVRVSDSWPEGGTWGPKPGRRATEAWGFGFPSCSYYWHLIPEGLRTILSPRTPHRFASSRRHAGCRSRAQSNHSSPAASFTNGGRLRRLGSPQATAQPYRRQRIWLGANMQGARSAAMEQYAGRVVSVPPSPRWGKRPRGTPFRRGAPSMDSKSPHAPSGHGTV